MPHEHGRPLLRRPVAGGLATSVLHLATITPEDVSHSVCHAPSSPSTGSQRVGLRSVHAHVLLCRVVGQALPRRGYTRIFENMLLDNPMITIRLNVDFFKAREAGLLPKCAAAPAARAERPFSLLLRHPPTPPLLPLNGPLPPSTLYCPGTGCWCTPARSTRTMRSWGCPRPACPSHPTLDGRCHSRDPSAWRLLPTECLVAPQLEYRSLRFEEEWVPEPEDGFFQEAMVPAHSMPPKHPRFTLPRPHSRPTHTLPGRTLRCRLAAAVPPFAQPPLPPACALSTFRS